MKRLVWIGCFVAGVLWAKPFQWDKNVEYVMGFYSMGITTSATLLDMTFLPWQMLMVRWNPFAAMVSFETTLRYFPLQHMGVSWWIFSPRGVNPYVYTGVEVPYTFRTLGVPVGLGLMHQWTNMSVHVRVYEEVAIVPVVVPSWSFELAVGFRW